MNISKKQAAAAYADLVTLHRDSAGFPESVRVLMDSLREFVLAHEGMKPVAGAAADSETSKEAARGQTMKKRTERMEQILAHISQFGVAGRTCEEVEIDLSIDHQTCSARIKDLRDRGDIVFAGAKRKTTSGCSAQVYITVEAFEAREA